MVYRYMDDMATADIAFEASGKTLEELFISAASATLNVMLENIEAIQDKERKSLLFQEADLDMLLLQLLRELVFFKDAENLLLRVSRARVHQENDLYTLTAEAYGEKIDPGRHELGMDVKGVTLHRFRVEKTSEGWETTVILDI